MIKIKDQRREIGEFKNKINQLINDNKDKENRIKILKNQRKEEDH